MYTFWQSVIMFSLFCVLVRSFEHLNKRTLIPVSIKFIDSYNCKFKKSYDLSLDLLQYRKENSAEYLVDRNFS